MQVQMVSKPDHFHIDEDTRLPYIKKKSSTVMTCIQLTFAQLIFLIKLSKF